MEHLQRVCHIKEVELHVDWGGRVLPGLKGFCAILQDCSLKQEKGRSAANAIMLHDSDRRQRNSMSWEQAQAERLETPILDLLYFEAAHSVSTSPGTCSPGHRPGAALVGLQFHFSPQKILPDIFQDGD